MSDRALQQLVYTLTRERNKLVVENKSLHRKLEKAAGLLFDQLWACPDCEDRGGDNVCTKEHWLEFIMKEVPNENS